MFSSVLGILYAVTTSIVVLRSTAELTEVVPHELASTSSAPIIWLLSFPHSGDASTERIIYSLIGVDNDLLRKEKLEAVYVGGHSSMSTQKVGNGELPVTVLKSHCGGICLSDCPPQKYSTTVDEFTNKCVQESFFTGPAPVASALNITEMKRREDARVIYIMRDPLSSIVSRYHYESKIPERVHSKESFVEWCLETKMRHVEAERYFFNEEMRQLLEGVPCHAEFFKWVQWYNNAFEMAAQLNLDVHVVHFNDIISATEKTITDLATILGWRGDINSNILHLQKDHDHTAFYSDVEKTKIVQFIKYIALERTRREIMRYTESYAHAHHHSAISMNRLSQSTKQSGWSYRHETYGKNSWCSQKKKQSYEAGLHFVKIHKAASSTNVGVTMRISQHVGKRTLPSKGMCNFNAHHWAKYEDRPYTNSVKTKGKTFLWSVVRNPEARKISHAFFAQVTRRSVKPTDENLINYLCDDNYQLNYLAQDDMWRETIYTAQPPWGKETGIKVRPNSGEDVFLSQEQLDTVLPVYVNKILEAYDFIGLVERMNESLVVLQLLLGLEATDILYLGAKITGGYDDGVFHNTCFKIQKSFVSPKVRKFLDSHQWQTATLGDRLLYKAVNAKLDATIEELGMDKFQAALSEYEFLMEKAAKVCSDKVIFPCSKDGVMQRAKSRNNCYSDDNGCGYPCLDALVEKHSMGNIGA